MQRIETLLGQLRQGAVTIEGETMRVPERVRLELEAKQDGVEVEITWDAPAKERSGVGEDAELEQRAHEPSAQA